MNITTSDRKRFMAKVHVAEDGCWEWTASLRPADGYGQFGLGGRAGRMYMAHRVSWEMHHGPIPDGLWVLHRCDNRPCVNPEHLFLGTHTDNMRDMVSKGRGKLAWTHCENGHPFVPDNMYPHPKQRVCRQCSIEAQRRYAARKKVAIT